MAAPGLLDRVLAASAYDAQQTGEEEPDGRPDNLSAPAPGRQAAHGRFDDRARAEGVVVSSGTLRGGAIAGGALISLAIGIAFGALLRGQRLRRAPPLVRTRPGESWADTARSSACSLC
jgi:hypothetical protein